MASLRSVARNIQTTRSGRSPAREFRALRKEAKALDALGVSFDLIISSPLTRTRQTANVFAEHLPEKPAVELSDSLAPAGTPAASANH